MHKKFDPAYYSADELLTRSQIAELTGVSIARVKYMINADFADFPKPLGKIDREFVYFKSDILAWLEAHDIDEDKPKERQSTLHNDLAREFLTQKYKKRSDQTD